jgi:hypothetical protein
MFKNKYLKFNLNPEESEDMGTEFKAVLYSIHRKKVVGIFFFFSLSISLQPFGPWPIFQLLNPKHSR